MANIFGYRKQQILSKRLEQGHSHDNDVDVDDGQSFDVHYYNIVNLRQEKTMQILF